MFKNIKMYFLFTVSLLFLSNCSVNRTIQKERIDVSEIYLHEKYEKGGTHGNWKAIFSKVEKEYNVQRKIEGQELNMIRQILLSSEIRKIPDVAVKTGVYLLYFEMIDSSNEKHRLILVYDNCFIDVDNSIQYCISRESSTMSDYISWLRYFQETHRGEKLEWYD